MSAKSQHNNILLAIIGFVTVVVAVAIIGWFTLDRSPEIIQGEVEVSEYRVSCKLPGRIVELRVKEGDYVHVGDTLAVLEMPEVNAQQQASEAAVGVADAVSDLVNAGARKETVEGLTISSTSRLFQPTAWLKVPTSVCNAFTTKVL